MRTSRVLRPDGKEFHAASNKSQVINEALDLLDQDGMGGGDRQRRAAPEFSSKA